LLFPLDKINQSVRLVENQGGDVMHNETITVGAFEAKTHLPSILDGVEAGKEYIITRHGKPVARVVPAAKADKKRIDELIARSRAAREGCTLGGISWKELRDAGRK
jgi:prevent-host-death family protein